MSVIEEKIIPGIDAKVAEVREEIRRLEAAREVLLDRPGRTVHANVLDELRKRPRRSTRPTRTRAKRQTAGRGERQAQALDLIRGNAGISTPRVADALGISRNHTYILVRRMEGMGLIRGSHDGWEAVRANRVERSARAVAEDERRVAQRAGSGSGYDG